jgi:hypothetical protein
MSGNTFWSATIRSLHVLRGVERPVLPILLELVSLDVGDLRVGLLLHVRGGSRSGGVFGRLELVPLGLGELDGSAGLTQVGRSLSERRILYRDLVHLDYNVQSGDERRVTIRTAFSLTPKSA